MKMFKKIMIYTAFLFAFAFIGFGYAAFTDTLSIRGSATVTIPYGLFITEVEVATNGEVNATSQGVDFLTYTTTVDASARRTTATGKVTYKITVLNNTSLTYAYRGLYYQSNLSGYNGNSIIGTANRNRISITTAFPDGQKVEAGQTLTFTATYTLGNSLNRYTTYRTLINYQFGINVESETVAKNVLIEKFANILNAPDTYNKLYDRIDDKFSGAEWTSNYIGNVTDSTSDDSATVNEIFAGFLQMTIDGVDTPITVLIKHENVDGRTDTGDDYTAVSGSSSFTGYGCEFTLYMTTSDLGNRNQNPPVYAAVFTCNRNADGSSGAWYLLGEAYSGTASIVGYEGGESTGSFDTGTWRSYATTYKVTDNYSYSVAANLRIQDVVVIQDPLANKEAEDLLNKTKKILDDNIYAGTGMVELEEAYFAYMQASNLYTINADGTVSVNPDATRVQLIPHIKKLSQVLSYFEGIIPE